MTISNRLLGSLDRPAVEALAQEHHASARELDTRAAELATSERIRTMAEQNGRRLGQLPGIIHSYLTTGMTLSEAIKITARAADALEATVYAHWKYHVKKDAELTRAIRDQRILQMASRAWTNKEIGRGLDPPLHPSSISRIIQRHLKALAAARKAQALAA